MCAHYVQCSECPLLLLLTEVHLYISQLPDWNWVFLINSYLWF